MLPQKFKHLEKAKELLAAGDPASLRYCCLELRTAIELVAYERVPLYKDELPIGFEKWQPKEIVEALVDCDPTADKDSTLRIGTEGPGGEPPKTMFSLGSSYALTKRFVQKHYHKLGSYLHAPTIAQIEARKEPLPDAEFLKKTITEVERLCSSTVMSNLRSKVDLVCQDCGTTTTRNSEALKRDGYLTCRQPSCKAVYKVEDVDAETLSFQIDQVDFDCPCGNKVFFGRHRLKDGLRITCSSCERVTKVSLVWNLAPEAASPTAAPPAPTVAPPPAQET